MEQRIFYGMFIFVDESGLLYNGGMTKGLINGIGGPSSLLIHDRSSIHDKKSAKPERGHVGAQYKHILSYASHGTYDEMVRHVKPMSESIDRLRDCNTFSLKRIR